MNTLVNQNQIASESWQKPSSWVDIRTGAQANSIYLLVGHKADFSKYNEFPIKVSVDNSGTYDIYIDGIKKYSAVASYTTTTINWQTLNLASGFDVTYPEALRTHIIRVTPTVSTNTLNSPSFVKNTLSNVGLLWLHFTTDHTLYIPQMCYAGGCNAPVLEAVTSSTGFLKTEWMELAFFNATSLKEIPIINITSGGANFHSNFYNTKIKKLEYKIDAKLSSGDPSVETNLSQCEEIVNTTQYPLHTSSFANCPKLKRIRGFFSKTFPETIGNLFGGDVAMEETFLDFSEGAQVKKLVIGGTSSVPLPWFKGLTVSASAPFDGTSPQLDVAYTGMTRNALVTLFDSLPTVTDSQVCNVTGASGAADLTADDIAVATAKGWSVTR